MRALSIMVISMLIVTGVLYAQPTEEKFASSQCPVDHIVLAMKSGDINGDVWPDLVLVYARKNEAATPDTLEPRIVEIFLGIGGKYASQGRNGNLLYPYGYDGNFPDSLVDIVIGDGQVIFHEYGGFVERWGRELVLVYDGQRKQVLFGKEVRSAFRADDPEALEWTRYSRKP